MKAAPPRPRRSPRFTGRNPSKTNRPVARPLTARAVMRAQQPGTAWTGTPLSAHRRTRSSPGSLMAGVPASVTRAKDAVRQVAAATGLGRNELYQAAIQRESP